MTANGANSRLRSEVHNLQQDGMTTTTSPMETNQEEPTHMVPLPKRLLQGPPRPTETPKDTTPTSVLVGNLIRTVQRQTSLTEEQNRHLMDLEQARHIASTRRTSSPTHSRRGMSPPKPRSRSPRRSVSIRSPSYIRRSSRRSPR
jgi:hypothetical protein